jgi:uncharacterized protein (TIGR02271 family)
MPQTVVGLFDTPAAAQTVKQQLTNEGYASGNIRVLSNESEGFAAGAVSETRSSNAGDSGIVGSVKNFFRSLTGADENEHDYYTRGVSAGGALLAVTVPDERVESVISLLEAHGARDVSEENVAAGQQVRAAAASTSAAATTSTPNVSGAGTAIPIVEEELQLGKRQVQRGGVRVYSHIVETPVEEDIRLREEHVRVQRTPVNRPASAADFNAFQEGSVELTETAEEPVVSKQARVVEEVRIGKEVTEHTEKVTDKLRRTEVDIEEIPAEGRGKTRPSGDR